MNRRRRATARGEPGEAERWLSLAFIDVIACTIGVVLLLMLLFAIGPVEAARGERRRENSASVGLRERIERLGERMAELRAAEAEWAGAIERRDELRRSVNEATGSLAAEARRRGGRPRKPMIRKTAKTSPVMLVFRAGSVRPIWKTGTRLGVASAFYTFQQLDPNRLLCLPEGEPMRPGEIIDELGELDPMLECLNPDEHYIECILYPDSFEAFIATRERLYAWGWEVGFVFMKAGAPMVCSYSAHPNYPH